jgi:hypothetical protein
MAHYIPAQGAWDNTDLAQAWICEIIRLHGVPVRIISDRGPLMNSKHWDTFLHYLNAQRVLSLAYYPQTDGQTERQNQTLEQYLQCYCALEQDDWAVRISIGEFAYNNSVHSTTGVTPFRAYYRMNPHSADWPEMALGVGESHMAHQVAAKVIELQQECRKKIEVANAYQKAYAEKRCTPIPFSKGDQVLVSNCHIQSTRPKKKLDWKFLGPGRIVDQIGPSAFKVDLPGLKNLHPVFHASLLEPYNLSGSIPHPEAPIHDTLHKFSDNIYKVEEMVQLRRLSRWFGLQYGWMNEARLGGVT